MASPSSSRATRCGTGLATYAIGSFSGYRHLGVGWTLADNNLPGGFLRLLFSFSAGLEISRIFKPRRIKGAFWISSLKNIQFLENTPTVCKILPVANGWRR